MNNVDDPLPNFQAIRKKGIHCFSTFTWKERVKEATFWMAKEVFDEMVGWWVYICKTDHWDRIDEGVNLGGAVVRRNVWGEWEYPPRKL